MQVLPELLEALPELTQWRRDIHQHPELAFEEQRTSDLVAERLASWGIEVHRGLATTGVVGVLQGEREPAEGAARAIGLRADMDALPMQEHNDIPHRSVNAGVFHGCGHDGHTTMLLAAARHLSRHRDFAGSGISLLGLDPKYTVILVDGQRVTGRVNGQIDLRRINIDQVEQIEIVRGGGSVLYGSEAVAGGGWV